MREAIEQLKQIISEAETVVIGAGSGLSTSAGFTYSILRSSTVFRICIRADLLLLPRLKSVGHTGAAIL